MPTVAPAEQPFFAEGMTVEIGKIHRELKKLWQNSQETATRASRLNLVVYSTAAHSLRANTAIVEKITHQHALRAILIASKANTGNHGIRAWVNAHCQISKDGRKQRCSEQIGFLLEGDSARRELVPNLIFSHLDSDLPLYLWRQGEFTDSPNEQLMSWVDCLIYDSADWPRPAAQFGIVRRLAAASNLENGLADLNWTRLGGLRVAIAQFFDAGGVPELDAVEITHAPGARTGALMLAGWLGAQLGWKPKGGQPAFENVALTLSESGGPRIGRVELRAKDGSRFTVSREAKANFYNTCARGGGRESCQMLPAGPEETADLVSAELVRCGGHRAYLKALETIEGWLE